jgi:methylmalonyl-CoA mutase
MRMEPHLFSEFATTTKESWKKQVLTELRGKNLDAQDWKIADNVSPEAYYTAQDIKDPVDIQLAQRKTTGWLNTPPITFETPVETNSRIRSALAAGADAILLDLGSRTLKDCDLVKTLHHVRLTDSFTYFATDQNPCDLYAEISRGASYYFKGGIASDPVAQWMRTGKDLGEALDQIDVVLQQTQMMKDFRPIMIESHLYHQAGANAVQELAFMMAALVHCTDHLTDATTTPLQALNRFFFSVSIGPEYLSEIAKLRALRLLYRKITRAYALPDAQCNAFVHARTSSFYRSDLAPTSNLIRVTSQAMSAVCGGCDALTVDEYKHDDDSASDIARNVSLLLAEEATMKQVADPAAGSYLIENMSLMLAHAAWNLFLRIEEKGGIVNSFRDGFVQAEVEEALKDKTSSLHHDKIMVGVNKYRETNDLPAGSPENLISKNLRESPGKFREVKLEEYLREDL